MHQTRAQNPEKEYYRNQKATINKTLVFLQMSLFHQVVRLQKPSVQLFESQQHPAKAVYLQTSHLLHLPESSSILDKSHSQCGQVDTSYTTHWPQNSSPAKLLS